MTDKLGILIQKHLHTVKVPKLYTVNNKHPYAGTCYVASEAYYHLSPDQERLQPVRVNMLDATNHWFLRSMYPKVPHLLTYIDLTSEQYEADSHNAQFLANIKAAASGGPQNAAFLTKQPSKRAKALMNLVLEDIV